MGKPLELPFDPIDRAAQIWAARFGPSPSMAAVTSIMRAQQILLGELDALLKPYHLTFARYEALVLLTFSRRGALPLNIIGERLMVHPTSVTNIISRLERQHLVARPRRWNGHIPDINLPKAEPRSFRTCPCFTPTRRSSQPSGGAARARRARQELAMSNYRYGAPTRSPGPAGAAV